MEVFGLSIALKEVGGKVVKASVDALRVVLADAAKEARKTDKAVSDLGGSFRTLAATITAGVGAREIATMADSYATLTARLKIATGSAEELATVQAALFRIAQDQRVPLENVSDLYARMARSAGDLGLNQSDLLRLTTTISQALAVSGTSAESAAGALFQLGQALNSGTVRAEEFNSIAEGTPRLLLAAAEGMGVSTKQLRDMMIAGKLTSQAFAQAILANTTVATEFAQVPRTISGAFTQLRNDVLQMVGVLDQSANISQRFGETLDVLRRNLPQIAAIVGSMAASWLAYNAAIRTAIMLNAVVSAAQTIAAIAALARTVKSVSDATALLSMTGGSLLKAAAMIVALAAGYAAFDTIMSRLEGSIGRVNTQMQRQAVLGHTLARTGVGIHGVLEGAPSLGDRGKIEIPKAAATKAAAEQLSAFEEYFRQQGLGRRPAEGLGPFDAMLKVDPASIRAQAQELGALIDTTFTEEVLATAQGLGDQLGNVLGSSVASAFEVLATRGATVGDAFGALGAAMLRGLGDMTIAFGISVMKIGKLMTSAVTALKSLNGPAAVAAGLAIVAVGGLMRGAAGRAFGGVGGGSAPVMAGGGLGGMAGPATLPGLTFGPTMAASASNVAASAPVNVTIIGTNDPSAQRQMQELIRNAQRRGGTTIV